MTGGRKRSAWAFFDFPIPTLPPPPLVQFRFAHGDPFNSVPTDHALRAETMTHLGDLCLFLALLLGSLLSL